MDKNYDVTIIGAGIGGLVCGCYLAQTGIKTLIVEKNPRPGGYCASFSRGGFHFDACAHALGKNILPVLEELGIAGRITMERNDPSDVIIAPDFTLSIRTELAETIRGFQNEFPGEHTHIREFFNWLDASDSINYLGLRKKTFVNVLDERFSDKRLKAVLSLLLLGNLGLPASAISAITAVKFYKQFIIDGGYYPVEGMQALPDILAKRFTEMGGTLLLSDLVTRVAVKDRVVEGVITKRNGPVPSRYVVSDGDATQLFTGLTEKAAPEALAPLHELVPSLSMFILYLGVDKKLPGLPQKGTNVWSLPHYDLDRMYLSAVNGDVRGLDWFLVRTVTREPSVMMLVNAPFMDGQYWETNKAGLIDIFIKKVEKVLPGLSNHVIFKDAATPHTLYKWTLNHRGAAYGWNSTPDQFLVPGMAQRTFIKNLYQTGHWSTVAQGLPGVIFLGRETARVIAKKEGAQ